MELILSLLTGGATGILGSLLGRVTGFFEKAQAQKFRQEEWGHERALIEMQMRGREGEWEHERAIAEADAAARMREASYAPRFSHRPGLAMGCQCASPGAPGSDPGADRPDGGVLVQSRPRYHR